MTSERPPDEPRSGEPGPDDPVEHLWRAAHELLLAARALVDAADLVVAQQLDAAARAKEKRAEPQPGAAQRPPRVRRIDVG